MYVIDGLWIFFGFVVCEWLVDVGILVDMMDGVWMDALQMELVLNCMFGFFWRCCCLLSVVHVLVDEVYPALVVINLQVWISVGQVGV